MTAADEIRGALAALAAADPARRAFGAARHGYALAPPLGEAGVAALEARLGAALPIGLREMAAEVGGGGAGPYHGWIAPARAAERLAGAPRPTLGWTRALPVAHLGCGYAAVVPLDGVVPGEVWLDARAVGLVAPIHATFATFYLEWLERRARAAWPEGYVAVGACPLPAALGGYFAVWEQRLGLASGSLDGDALREALDELGPGAIEIAAHGAPALFDDGDRVDPCIVCARVLDGLAADGLRRDVLIPGVPPIPER